MILHQTQKPIARSRAAYRAVVCGRQWGKTTLSVEEMKGAAWHLRDAKVLYLATTREQARNIAWEMLKASTHEAMSRKPNETRLELYLHNKYGGESTIFLGGYENIETARGQQFDLIVADEVAQMRNFMYVWNGILRPTLIFRKGKALFIGTPRGYNHLYEMYKWGQDKAMPEWESWRYTSHDNPYLDKVEIENARKDSTAEYFNQEYLAEFTRFTGLVYPEFSDENVYYFDHQKNSTGTYIFGLDFAVRGYTAAVAMVQKPNADIYVLDNYKTDGLTAATHGPAIKDMLIKYASLDQWVGYSDPAGWAKTQQGERGNKPMVWSLADEYLEQDFPIIKANNEVTAGINYVKQMFSNKRIHIHSRCAALVSELYQYQWKDQPTTQVGTIEEPEKIRKINDHLVDALRYALYSKPTAPEPESPYQPGMPIIFGAPKIAKPEDEDFKAEVMQFDSIYD